MKCDCKVSIIYLASESPEQVDPKAQKRLLQESNRLGVEWDEVPESHLREILGGTLPESQLS